MYTNVLPPRYEAGHLNIHHRRAVNTLWTPLSECTYRRMNIIFMCRRRMCSWKITAPWTQVLISFGANWQSSEEKRLGENAEGSVWLSDQQQHCVSTREMSIMSKNVCPVMSMGDINSATGSPYRSQLSVSCIEISAERFCKRGGLLGIVCFFACITQWRSCRESLETIQALIILTPTAPNQTQCQPY